MHDRNGIIAIAKDEGEAKFNVDFGTGMVNVSVRPPLGLELVTANVDILTFLDCAATVTLELNKQHRQSLRQLARVQAKA